MFLNKKNTKKFHFEIYPRAKISNRNRREPTKKNPSPGRSTYKKIQNPGNNIVPSRSRTCTLRSLIVCSTVESLERKVNKKQKPKFDLQKRNSKAEIKTKTYKKRNPKEATYGEVQSQREEPTKKKFQSPGRS